MQDQDRNAPLGLQDSEGAELRMRRALGLEPRAGAAPQQRPDQARPRHRFVQDGAVPVTVLNARHEGEGGLPLLRERLATLEQTLRRESAALSKARTLAEDLERQNRALQTRLTHAEIATREAAEAEQRLRAERDRALAELAAARAGLEAARAAHPTAPVPVPVPAPVPAAVPKPPAEATAKRKRGRPRLHPAPEAKPVRWWTPSYRAKAKS